MLHPIGRLPPQIYWRRRLLLVGIVLVVGLVAVGLLNSGASDASGDSDTAAAGSAAETTSEQAADDQRLPGLEQVVPSLAPAEPDEPGESGAPGSTPAPAPEPATPAPAAEPGPCPDEAIGLTVGSEVGQYAAGSKPLLSLTIANISAIPCYRDLDLAAQIWGLFAADGTRLWGSNDCFPEPSGPNSQLLQPGQVVAFSIIWSGLTSEPSCTTPRQVLAPGTYVLRGYLANLVSPDVPLVLT